LPAKPAQAAQPAESLEQASAALSRYSLHAAKLAGKIKIFRAGGFRNIERFCGKNYLWRY
jgi:hypothetical protein